MQIGVRKYKIYNNQINVRIVTNNAHIHTVYTSLMKNNTFSANNDAPGWQMVLINFVCDLQILLN